MASIVVKFKGVEGDDDQRKIGMTRFGKEIAKNIKDSNQTPKQVVWQSLKPFIDNTNDYSVCIQRRAKSGNKSVYFELSKVNSQLYTYVDTEYGNKTKYLYLNAHEDGTEHRVQELNIAVPKDRDKFRTSYLDDLLKDVGVDPNQIDEHRRNVALAYIMFSRCR